MGLREKFEYDYREASFTPIARNDGFFEVIDETYGISVVGPTPEEAVANAIEELFAKYENMMMTRALEDLK